MAIRLRKKAYFHRSLQGAHVGDIYMSLTHTAELHGANPGKAPVSPFREVPEATQRGRTPDDRRRVGTTIAVYGRWVADSVPLGGPERPDATSMCSTDRPARCGHVLRAIAALRMRLWEGEDEFAHRRARLGSGSSGR